ncbi:DUF1440 domain-containing protein [Leuconostocaceae bacterium ESL0958]|nr:DUF1440 domain-containing protein [Leuconostocaceae bacterium ESL0958]
MGQVVVINVVWVGFLAGLLAGLTKTGWSVTVGQSTTGVKERLLKELGVTVQPDRSDWQRFLPVLLHYLFSIFFALFFIFWANFDGQITRGQGSLYGLLVFLCFEWVLYPLLRIQRPFWRRPILEQGLSLAGYLLWAVTVYLVALGLPASGVFL